ncbi:hypothetical protein CNMCM6457_004200 [Aspergillus fumigatiaffinis]|nr:hypothetical protein CNMCM6457_004200 [Aspergillus fumigatiaffinis]
MVAEHLQIRGMLGASFFFEDGSKDRGNATRLFSTIAKQLAANVPLLIPGISKAVALDPDISSKPPKLQFDRLLLQPLLSLDQDSRTTTKVLVIDGLEECIQDDIQTILHLLLQLQRSTCVPIRIFLTSNPVGTICQGFRGLTDYQDIDLHKVRAAGTDSQTLTERIRLLLERTNFESDASGSELSDDASCPPSVFSKPSILSTAVTGNSLLTKTEMGSAIGELVSIFFEDQNMNLLYQVAVGDRRIGPERFARNFRRLLKLFSDGLKDEAQDSFDMELANLVQSKAGLVANTIRDKIKLIYDDPRDLSTTDMSEKPIQDMEKDRLPDHTSTVDMDDTDDTDSDGDVAAERAHERFAVLVSRGRSFIEESNAFKKLRKDLEKFVFPALEEVPQVKPESANEHHPAPSDPIGISPARSERKYYLTLQRFLCHIGLQESNILPHHRRLRWTNRRGEKLYDDYIEHEPGALQVLRDYLDTCVERTKTTSEGGQGQTSAHPTSSQMSIPSLTWVHNTGATNIADKAQLPEGVRSSFDQKDVELGEDSNRTLRLMSCIERRGHPVTLHQEVVSHIKDDRELFHALRCIYHNHKGRFESFWSLRTIHAIHFMKFTYGGHPYIDVRCHNEICEKGKPCNCIPPPRLVPPMGAEYECCPVPPKLSPPVGPQLMVSLFNDPDSIQSGAALIMQQLPKRLNGKLYSPCFEQEEAWGIYYEEGWNWAKIWLFLAIGFFLPSLVFGVLWGILKRDVQGAFGIASWWMTGATIILGVIGTCS